MINKQCSAAPRLRRISKDDKAILVREIIAEQRLNSVNELLSLLDSSNRELVAIGAWILGKTSLNPVVLS